MKIKWRVYYCAHGDNPWEDKFKTINAKSEEEAIKKFKEKYPELGIAKFAIKIEGNEFRSDFDMPNRW